MKSESQLLYEIAADLTEIRNDLRSKPKPAAKRKSKKEVKIVRPTAMKSPLFASAKPAERR